MNMKSHSIKESFNAGLKHALYSNFSKYTDAFLELADNAVSDRIVGVKSVITILVSSKSFEITNYGGYGMNLNDLESLLDWGKIKERRSNDIGAYGQGGKAAMGYLGNSMRIIASPKDKRVEYRFHDDDLHNMKLKKYDVEEIETEIEKGYVKIEVNDLKRKFKNEEVKKILIETYRPLIDNDEIEINFNSELIKTEKFPIDKTLLEFEFKVNNYTKGLTRNVKGWVGYLLPRSGIRGGIKCYKLGRLISDREYFGHPDPSNKQSLNFLFGEIYIDHVPVTTNKTDFDRNSVEWEEVQSEMFKILQPYIDELLGREVEEPTDEEKKRVKEVRDYVAELLRMRQKEMKGSMGVDGVAFGQKSPVKKEKENADISKNEKLGSKEPKTPPPSNAIGKRKRLKEFMDWMIRPMDENIRSKIEVSDKNNKVLVINNLFSGFKAAKGNEIYLIESAALQLTLPDGDEKITPKEYLNEFDDLFSFFCSNLNKVKASLKKKKASK